MIEAVALLRAARAGTLATVDAGRPYASLVTPATAPDRAPLLFLSGLSPHTRHLRANPSCSLLLAGDPTDANPQTAPRLTLTGTARPDPDPAFKARWLAVHPYAAFYADLADFGIWRIEVEDAHFVGGFARATPLAAAALRPDPVAMGAVEAAASGIMEHCNADHAASLTELAGSLGPWRMVAIDIDGCVLATHDRSRRVAWPAPVASAAEIRAALIAMLRQARATAPPATPLGLS